MVIVINLSIIQAGGGMQAALSLIEELNKIPDHIYHFIVSNNIHRSLPQKNYSETISFYVIHTSPSKLIGGKKSRIQIRNLVNLIDPDVVFTLYGPPYIKFGSTHLCGFALGHHIYPESPFFRNISIAHRVRLKILKNIQLAAFKRECDFYVAETQDASSRLVRQLNVKPEAVFTVNNAYNGIFDDPGKWVKTHAEKLSVDGFKMITISSFYPHKNLSIIPKVIDYLVTQYPGFNFSFILTIDSDKLGDLTDTQNEHIKFIGKVAIEECPPLYKHADALFMPTLLECFTVSYLEAMKMERPILTSDLSFARELCGAAALYFDPLDPKSIGESIYELAHNKLLQKRLKIMGNEQLKKFGSAQDRAIAYLDILEQIHGNNTSKN